jgi:hypothetical protein
MLARVKGEDVLVLQDIAIKARGVASRAFVHFHVARPGWHILVVPNLHGDGSSFTDAMGADLWREDGGDVQVGSWPSLPLIGVLAGVLLDPGVDPLTPLGWLGNRNWLAAAPTIFRVAPGLPALPIGESGLSVTRIRRLPFRSTDGESLRWRRE